MDKRVILDEVEKYKYSPSIPSASHMKSAEIVCIERSYMLHRTLSVESLVPLQRLVVLWKPACTGRTQASDVLTLDVFGEETRFTTSLDKGTSTHHRVRCMCLVHKPRHLARWLDSCTHRTHQQSHCSVQCQLPLSLLNQDFVESRTFQNKVWSSWSKDFLWAA